HCPRNPAEAKSALAPISLARAFLQETKSELQKMEEQQEMRNAMLEQMVTETANQVNEQVRSWGSTPTTRWLGAADLSVQEEQERAKADCSNCSFDINMQLGEFLHRCEDLQEQVDSLASQTLPCSAPNVLPSLEQDEELKQHVDTTAVQMKGEYEKLRSISGSLQKDSQQKQKAIEV
ncbi:QRIC2 protein, partial [Origma solitaria]|nr:QRIC2 protein [Origma solitaria]